MSALDQQVGGDHYKNIPYQPVVFITKMRYNFIQGCILKYVLSYMVLHNKEEIEKAIHYCQLGQELNPVNLALAVDVNEQEFLNANSLGEDMKDLIRDITDQFWIGISTRLFEMWWRKEVNNEKDFSNTGVICRIVDKL